jgi:hypothetical protein
MLGRTPLVLITLCAVFLPIGESSSADPDLHLRLEPAHPAVGQPFHVVADGTSCLLLFTGTPYGDGYESVDIVPGLVRAQVGYLLTFFAPCDNAPHSVRLPVAGLPAGNYTIQLFGRAALTTQVDLMQEIMVEIAGATQRTTPRSIPATGLSSSLLLLCAVLGIAGWRFLRGRQGTCE